MKRSKPNEKVRTEMRKSGVTQWELADHLGISESYFSRIFGRYELDDLTRVAMIGIVHIIAAEKKEKDFERRNERACKNMKRIVEAEE